MKPMQPRMLKTKECGAFANEVWECVLYTNLVGVRTLQYVLAPHC